MGTTAEKLEYLSDTKELIRLAIIEKGVQVDTSDTFRSYPEKIAQIEAGSSWYNFSDLIIQLNDFTEYSNDEIFIEASNIEEVKDA